MMDQKIKHVPFTLTTKMEPLDKINLTLSQQDVDTNKEQPKVFDDNTQSSKSDEELNQNRKRKVKDELRFSKENKQNCCLKITNFPMSWNYKQIKDYIESEFDPVKNVKMLDAKESKANGSVEVDCLTKDQYDKMVAVLQGREIESVQLVIDANDDSSSDDDDGNVPPESSVKRLKLNPDREADAWATNDQGTYGLKKEYLASLGICPPITEWVHVTDFRCDKYELREVMELAGRVLVCVMLSTKKKYAKVQYSHPLEAVQAVSMLNKRMFYGVNLKLTIQKYSPESLILPKGLANVGPGLGANGKPLGDIVRHYERYLNKKSSLINADCFRHPDDNLGNRSESSNAEELFRMETDNLMRDITGNGKSPTLDHDGMSKPGDFSDCPSPASSESSTWKLDKGSHEVMPYKGKSSDSASPSSSPTRVYEPRGSNICPNIGSRRNGNIPAPGPYMNNIGPRPRNTGPINNNMPRPMGMQGPNIGFPGSRPMLMPSMGPNIRHPGPTNPNIIQLTNANFRPSGFNNLNPSEPNNMWAQNMGPYHPNQGSNMGPQFCNQGPNIGAMRSPQGLNMGPVQFGPQGIQNMATGQFSGTRPNGPFMRPVWPQDSHIEREMINDPAQDQSASCVVEISNLPLSTTFGLLSEQLSGAGRLRALQLRAPGVARATFATPAHALRCYTAFNDLVVNANKLKVKIV